MEAPLFNLHADASITGGRGALLFDSFDQVVWAYDTTEEITAQLQAQAGHKFNAFVDAYVGPVLEATRLATQLETDYRLAIEREMLQLIDFQRNFQIVDSGATIAPAAPLPPNVPVLDLDAFSLALMYLFSCFQTVRLSTLIQRWASVLPLIWLALQQRLVTLVPNPLTTSLVSISAALTASSKTCSFRRRLSGPWLTLGRRSTSYGTSSSPPTFGLVRMRFEVFREWLRLLSARLFSMFLCLRMFRMRRGLLNISLQVTTIRGSCLMRGSRSSRSRLSPTKGMWCASEDQRAGSLWAP